MKKLVLLICLLFPLTVFGANLKFGSNYFDCTNFQTKGIISSGSGSVNYCIKAKCDGGQWQTQRLFVRGNTVSCSNGNENYYQYVISSGCNDYQGTCSNNTETYCGITYAYDCNKVIDGSIYIPKKPTTSNRRTSTTKKRKTTRPNITKTTTTTTTTTIPVKDSNAFLKNLTIKGYNINFYKEQLTYEIVIDKSVNKVDVEYETESDKAVANVRNNDPISIINPIIITVTAEDGSIKDYTINLTYKALSNNINVRNLTIENYDIDFDNNKQNYDVVVNQDTKSLNFNIELEDENAKYEIQDNNDLVNGSVIKIRVIAENLTETTYNFNIIKETTTVPKKKSNFFTILLIFLILGIIGVVVFKFIRNILPAKADEKYDYE
ncbi:MAG: hypothetical protein J6K23_02240 [Bacilli bacterium]|nr:hypothetical protein [Bacilli bacterium]